MEKFIHRENIQLYKRLLAEPHDLGAERHKLLLKLLAGEEAKDGVDRRSKDK